MKIFHINFDGRKKESIGRFQNIQKTIIAKTLDEAIENINKEYFVQEINSTTELENVTILI